MHRALGPGLLENIYQQCLAYELSLRDINFKSEFNLPINYKGTEISASLRCDFLIEDMLVVELKSVETVLPIHKAQLLTYMKLLRKPMGLMINFNCTHIYSERQRTYVNEYFEELF